MAFDADLYLKRMVRPYFWVQNHSKTETGQLARDAGFAAVLLTQVNYRLGENAISNREPAILYCSPC